MDDQSTLDRRRLITLLGTGMAASIAGCSTGAGSDSDPATDSGEATTTATTTTTTTTTTDTDTSETKTTTEETTEPPSTTTTASEPVSVPEDARCPVCNMMTAKFSAWNTQVVHEDGTRVFPETAGCMVAYYAVPEKFAPTDSPIVDAWATEFETGETVDATTAYFALESDPDRVDDPMRLNPAVFATHADAVAYVDAVDYLTADDVVRLDAFDRDLAMQYRRKFLVDE